MTNLRSGLAFLRAAMELSSLVIGSRSLSLGSAYLMTKGTWPRWGKSDSKCLKWSNVWYLDLSSEKRRNSASNFDLTSTVPSNWNDRTEWFIIVCRFVKALNSHCVLAIYSLINYFSGDCFPFVVLIITLFILSS